MPAPNHPSERPSMHQCGLLDRLTGLPCPAEYSRAFSLHRHIQAKHPTPTVVTPECTPGTDQHDLGYDLSGSDSPTLTPDRFTDHLPPTDDFVSESDPSDDCTDSTASTEPSDQASERKAPESRKRKLSITGFDRILKARMGPPMPQYAAVLSTKLPHQPKALDWLSGAAKRTFDEELNTRLAQWGVSNAHQGTCVLIPEQWKGADPMEILRLFDVQNCPTAQAGRLRYQYSDHVTAFVRAKAWFDQWPRRCLDLDNFVGAGPYKPLDASHRCHQNLCVTHIQFEPADINQDRKRCCALATKLRREKKEIPESCVEHDPPCLLQHAALTTNEALCIQMNILRQAKKLDSIAFQRPRRHPYSTFEATLPCQFPAVKLNHDHLVANTPHGLKPQGKPDLFCLFCPKIVHFDTLAGYWGHIVKKHDGLDTVARLAEIRRTAAEWQIYWEDYSDGGKRGQKTSQRLIEIEDEGFCWETVLGWGLR